MQFNRIRCLLHKTTNPKKSHLKTWSTMCLAGCVSFLEIDDLQEANRHEGKPSIVPYS